MGDAGGRYFPLSVSNSDSNSDQRVFVGSFASSQQSITPVEPSDVPRRSYWYYHRTVRFGDASVSSLRLVGLYILKSNLFTNYSFHLLL
jgi:hypothetical protein